MNYPSQSQLTVSPEEAGMKLLRFLERRLAAAADHQNQAESKNSFSSTLLHKWIRTGQVRINGKRSKPFALLAENDLVRIPPFAQVKNNTTQVEQGNIDNTQIPSLGEGLAIAAVCEDLLVLNKCGGLPVQPGSNHTDSLTTRLVAAYAGRHYIPAPAHRIDRHTSGLVLVGLSHKRQSNLHTLFASGVVAKEYLAWVYGAWEYDGIVLLTDQLQKLQHQSTQGQKNTVHQREAMCALSGGSTEFLTAGYEYNIKDGLQAIPTDIWDSALELIDKKHIEATPTAGSTEKAEARCLVEPLFSLPSQVLAKAKIKISEKYQQTATLLHIRLLTGKTHQIRVQLASRGYPIIGDGRYGGPSYSAMLLHAWRLKLPDLPLFSAAPPWEGIFKI